VIHPGDALRAPVVGSVVDLDHRVHGAPELYVIDASVFPTSASAHTMIPVMTFADRAVRRLLS
jgi:choline dehydrogenase-like flavoprotein